MATSSKQTTSAKHGRNAAPSNSSGKRFKNVDVVNAEIEVMHEMKSVIDQRLQRGPSASPSNSNSQDEIFGKMNAGERSQFDDNMKFQVKNELNKVIDEHRLLNNNNNSSNSNKEALYFNNFNKNFAINILR